MSETGQPLPKTHFLISMPRIAFTENLFCIIDAIQGLGRITKSTGAFWDQCMERIMEDAIGEGAEWLCTIDYDTIFNRQTFLELAAVMTYTPGVDAVFPLQSKRATNTVMASLLNDDGSDKTHITGEELQANALPAKNGHFGLTLLRVSALQKMAKPWFLPVPGPDGGWREGRLDSDMRFWKVWRECGNSLFLAPRVRIGHLQQLVTWPDAQFQPVHQYVDDWAATRKPPACVPTFAPCVESKQ
jgi:hypothetical protein